MHDITPCWLSKGRGVKGCLNEKRMTMLARGDTRCNWAVLCTSQLRKCSNGNVFHRKRPDKLLCLIIAFNVSLFILGLKVLRPGKWGVKKKKKMKGHPPLPLPRMVIHQADFDSKTHRSPRTPRHNLSRTFPRSESFHGKRWRRVDVTVWSVQVGRGPSIEAGSSPQLWIRTEEMTFVKICTTMLLNVPPRHCKSDFVSFQVQANNPKKPGSKVCCSRVAEE